MAKGSGGGGGGGGRPPAAEQRLRSAEDQRFYELESGARKYRLKGPNELMNRQEATAQKVKARKAYEKTVDKTGSGYSEASIRAYNRSSTAEDIENWFMRYG